MFDASDWRSVATAVVTGRIAAGRCFSSGEVAAELRTTYPDLRFSVTRLGEHVRDMFYTPGTLPDYDDDGDGNGPCAPVMTPRYAVGLYPDRTPAGTMVFVYGPSIAAAEAHDFEVFVPRPGETASDAPVPATPVKVDTATAFAAAIKDGVGAPVWPDGRLCIPRSAFEAAVGGASRSVKGGDSVYVTNDGKTVVVTLDPPAGTYKTYALTKDNGRIAITGTFTPGAKYPVTIEPGKITVNI